MQGTAWRCRGAVRGLRRAGEDFITQSFIDSDHIPGGRRSAQHPHQLPGSAPRACGAPQQSELGAGLGAPRQHSPSHNSPGEGSGGSLQLPVGLQSPQTGLFLFCPAGRLLPPPWQIRRVLQRGLRRRSWGSLPSQPTYPPQGSPTSRCGGSSCPAAPVFAGLAAVSARTPGRSSCASAWLCGRENKSSAGFPPRGFLPRTRQFRFPVEHRMLVPVHSVGSGKLHRRPNCVKEQTQPLSGCH